MEKRKKVMITETILRDAHQSHAATRMYTNEMIPVLEQLDDIGYYSLEAWGGATFDTCLRFLNEDPWMRLRTFKKILKKTPIQMLLRGQNLLGYRHYADDVVDKFIAKSIENGVSVIRVFDALNDVRNLESSMRAIKKYGGICEAAIAYTTSPVHTTEYFIKLAKELEQMGADNIAIKDMANLLLPYTVFDLVTKLKKALKPTTKIHLHTHNTAGTGDMVNLKAIEAGVDIVDCALSPLANGTSQPATEPLVATLAGTQYDTGIEIAKLMPIVEHFKKIAERLRENGHLSHKVLQVDINTLLYQIPGGMLSNLIAQLKQQNRLHQLDEVLLEVPNVRKDCGYPPLVTPTSQIVGTQAVFNIIMGERYKMVTKEFKNMLKGEYGTLPVMPTQEILEKCIPNQERIFERPADSLEPEYEKLKNEIQEYIQQEEDVLSYAMFGAVAINFFKWRMASQFTINEEL